MLTNKSQHERVNHGCNRLLQNKIDFGCKHKRVKMSGAPVNRAHQLPFRRNGQRPRRTVKSTVEAAALIKACGARVVRVFRQYRGGSGYKRSNCPSAIGPTRAYIDINTRNTVVLRQLRCPVGRFEGAFYANFGRPFERLTLGSSILIVVSLWTVGDCFCLCGYQWHKIWLVRTLVTVFVSVMVYWV